jgi:hypothetical protein
MPKAILPIFRFLISLVRYARPIAERAGDTAPGVH